MIMVVMLVLLVIVVMVVTATGAVLIMVMMMVMLMFLVVFLCRQTLHLQPGQFRRQAGLAFHGLEQLLAGQGIPGGGDNGGHTVVLPEHGHGSIQLGLGNGIGPGQDNGGGGFHLVVVELSEVLHIHLDLARISNRHSIAQGDLVIGDLVHGADHIGQLAHTGGLNENPVGIVFRNHLGQGLAEVAHQGAADAAGIHLGDVDARILQEAAVNADLAELILNQHQLLTLVALGNQLFNQGCFAGAQKAGENINFGHRKTPSVKNSLPIIISPAVNPYKKRKPNFSSAFPCF